MDPALFQALLRNQAALRNAPREGEFDEEAVWLHTDLGPSYYLTRSGRILINEGFDAEPAPREGTEQDFIAALVLGAKNLSEPRLIELLPARPEGATTCGLCQGSRWVTIPKDQLNPEDVEFLCRQCQGRGWT